MMMKKTALMVRCVPRCGFENTEVRTVDLALPRDVEEGVLRDALEIYFSSRGITDAIYDVEVDDWGFFAVVNDEAYDADWGTPVN
jgi:hypothetical protein